MRLTFSAGMQHPTPTMLGAWGVPLAVQPVQTLSVEQRVTFSQSPCRQRRSTARTWRPNQSTGCWPRTIQNTLGYEPADKASLAVHKACRERDFW